jgi:hypothetical protein
VLVENGVFRMWYDGRKDLPMNAPAAKGVPKSANSVRAVGYAESPDGIHWNRPSDSPVFEADAGGIHVVKVRGGYAMVYEGHDGTHLATSSDGRSWQAQGLLAAVSGDDSDRFGHVTPFLMLNEDPIPATLFIGAARGAMWDRNSIARIQLSPAQLQRINGEKSK